MVANCQLPSYAESQSLVTKQVQRTPKAQEKPLVLAGLLSHRLLTVCHITPGSQKQLGLQVTYEQTVDLSCLISGTQDMSWEWTELRDPR